MQRNELSPVSTRERFFTNPGFVALWASLGMGIPAIALGAVLGSESGMGLTFIQVLLVVPLGLVLGGAVISAVGWMAADNGVPTGLLFRPSLGVAGSWVASVLQALLYVGWTAIEIQIASKLLDRILLRFGVEVPAAVAIGIVTVILAGLIWLGMAWVSGVFIRRIAFWVALAVMVWALFDVASDTDLSTLQSRVPDQRQFWLGIDMIVAFVMLWVPLAGDTARFAPSTSAATTGVGLGFGVGFGTMLLVGAMGGLGGVIGGSLGDSLDYFDVAASPVMLIVGIAWLLAGELDQPFGFVYGASTGLATTTMRRSPAWLLLLVVALSGVIAALASQGSMLGLGRFLLAIFTPLIAVLLADFYAVRNRRYLMDGLYQSSGPYSGVNLFGLTAFGLAFALQQWIQPSGPVDWISLVERIPGAGSWGEAGAPAMMVGMIVAFGLYTALGRWKIDAWERVSELRL